VSRWRIALLLAALAGYALLSHWMMLYHPAAPWAVAALLGPLWLSSFGLVPPRHVAWGYPVIGALGLGLGALVMQGQAGDVDRLYMLQHVAINLLLGAWFASSLRPGRLPLISGFATRVHGTLSAGMQRYTRRLTIIWVLYFFLMAVASVSVYAFFPFKVWSLLGNVLTPVLVATLFAGEHLVRYRLHPEFERATMADAVRAFRATTR
jgi:uncharacterized membrane protein